MSGSSDLIGQRKIVNEIIAAITPDENFNRYFLITGPSGSGKSYIANTIAKQWLTLDTANGIIYSTSHNTQSERRYFPFISAINGQIDRSAKEIITKGGIELSRGIPYAGDLVGYLIEALSNNKSFKKKETIRYLKDIEQLILFDIEKHIGSGKTILVADNLQWWDEDSLNLLQLIITGKLNEEFPSFKRLVFILINTSDQEVCSPKSIEPLLNDVRFTHIFTEYITEANFLKALHLFGYKIEFAKEIVHILYTITAGHLLLIKRLAEYLQEHSDSKEMEVFIKGQVDDKLKAQFIEELFAFRLKTLGAQQSQVIQILEYAAIIGLSFTHEELQCLSKENELNLLEIIENAKKSSLIDGDIRNRSFAHDIVRQFFLSRLKERKSIYNKKFSECLSVLRPSDYFTRASHLFDSGNVNDSLCLYMLGHFRNLRQSNSTNQLIINRIKQFSSSSNLLELYNSITYAYEFFEGSKFEEAIRVLKSIEDIYPVQLLAEKYYLLSLCISRPMQTHSLKESIECLNGWESLQSTESEIWLRIMSTKMVMHAHLYDFEKAKSVEKAIMLHLVERLKFDSSANENINILRRKSGSIHIAEIATVRTKKSVEYFSTPDTDGTLRSPIQYYMAVNNHAGNLMVLGEYSESFEYAKLAIDTISTYSSLSFPKPFVPGNNYILSGLLGKSFSVSDSLSMYAKVSENLESHADDLLIKNNIAILHCLNNNLQVANQIFEYIVNRISRSTELDNYYQYYTISNWACVRFLLGDKDKAKILWNSLIDKIPKVSEAIYLVRRHELIMTSFLSNNITDPWEWQNHLFKSNPYELGKSWKFFGQGFLFSDIQFWSES